MLYIKKRKLPHWELEKAIYYITFSLLNGKLTVKEMDIVFRHIHGGKDKYYNLFSLVVMPTHVHLVLQPLKGFSLSRIMKGIKGASARKINLFRKTSGSVWLDESYDHIVRNEADLARIFTYIENNPYRANLLPEKEKYPFYYLNKHPSNP